MSIENVHDAHFMRQIDRLHTALIEIMSVMNRPQQDESLLKKSDIKLDRGLFPLLVIIAKFGPICVGDLADRIGRDYTTVSRQTAKMESIGLIAKEEHKGDKRTKNSIITDLGKIIIENIDNERILLSKKIFSDWTLEEMEVFIHLLTKFSNCLSFYSSK
ncbi:MarR family winged helix-turn-helix transcriptional regulator [Gluconobacter cerinus]|uniref:MarR family winged helix-turn-helix transcriptional regulator n=1 Tax=Gluconobacter cerinus TaxID=38307 RepID=UPI001B8AA9AC|nr:MarR family transcriptional regulator [Gluconobacter cerinus]MBS1039208.1 MarR family transcriptional regulator [Gluconobacter cerinus]